MDNSFFISEPAAVYHGKAKDYLSSHQLIDYIKCPKAYYRKITSPEAETEDTAFLIGRATHALILEGREVFDAEFAAGGPINPKTGKPYGSATKAFTEWAAAQTKSIITMEQAELIEKMREAVNDSPIATDLIKTGSAEGVVRTNYCSVPCQIRVDWFNPSYGIVDFKTCDDLDWFPQDAKRYRYHNQMAFYQAVLKEVTGEDFPVYFIAAEKREPYRCGVWQVLQETLDTARDENRAAIGRLKLSREQNLWPTGYESLRYLSIN